MKRNNILTQLSARELAELYIARHYAPIYKDFRWAKGVWLKTVNDRRFLDAVAGYSALNAGHNHDGIVGAMVRHVLSDAPAVLTGGVMHVWKGLLGEKLAKLTGMNWSVFMNSGAEAVETAIKIARKRKWHMLGEPNEENFAPEIIVFDDNFHGRTTTIVGFSSTEQYRRGFGPFAPGFIRVPYGDIEAVKNAVN